MAETYREQRLWRKQTRVNQVDRETGIGHDPAEMVELVFVGTYTLAWAGQRIAPIEAYGRHHITWAKSGMPKISYADPHPRRFGLKPCCYMGWCDDECDGEIEAVDQ